MKRLYVPIFALMLLISGFSFISHSATYISTSQKQIIRDSKRLNDLTIFRKAIEDYKTKNGFYPKLETGTNIKGYVASVWGTQWTSFCNLIGLDSCPIDPVNEIVDCDCSAFDASGNCSGNNINTNIDQLACYNSKDQKFVCTTGSNVYQYKALNNGRNYSLMMDFEYRKDGDATAGADYWNVNDKSNNNDITIDNNCTGVVLSNALPNCGDGVMQFGEQCDRNDKIEFCTNTKGELGKMAIKCVNCKYEVKETKLTSNCNTSDFCGDGVVNVSKGEECDGGYEKMCFNSNNSNLGKHDWYAEKLRSCQSNCKWDKTDSYKNSLTLDVCGGYCGDDNVQGSEDCDFGVEYSFWDNERNAFKKCSDYKDQASCNNINCVWPTELGKCLRKDYNSIGTNQKHCYVRSGSSCKYINNSPVLPTIKNSNFSALSYIKEGSSYTESVSSINETTLFVNRISRNSVYLEFSLDGIAPASNDNISDVDGDEIMYKFDFVDKANNTVGFYKGSDIIGNDSILSVNRGTEITGKWIKHSDLAKRNPADNNKFTTKIYFRIYATSLSKNLEEANKNIIQLLDGSYFGDYKFRISVKDNWVSGPNVDGNKQGIESSKEINFYIGSSCGDHVLQAINDEGQHEYCEWKPGYNKFTNWSVNEPSGNGNCATIKTGTGWNAKWDDVPCGDAYYGICKKITKEICPIDWINSGKTEDGVSNVCYGLTSKTTYDAASTECYYNDSNKALLVNILNPAENNLIKGYISSKLFKNFDYNTESPIFWIGFYNIKKLRTLHPNNFPVETNDLSLWSPSSENGNPDVYGNAVYNGGSGKSFSSQYLCSNTCNDIGGYCGDGILENGTQDLNNSRFYTIQTNADKTTARNYYLGNFEQCDPTSQGKDASFKGQTGLGTGFYLQDDGTKIGDNYGCSACSLVGGYCGSGTINNLNFKNTGYIGGSDSNVYGSDYEHCDPRYVLKPEDSSNNNKDRGNKPNYVCAASGDNISISDTSSNVYKIPNPKSEARMTWIAYGDVTNKLNLSDFIKKPSDGKTFNVNANGACQGSTGGYCGDGKIQMAYIGYDMSQNLDEKYAGADSYYYNTYDNSKLLYNDKDLYTGSVLDLQRKIIIGTSNYRNSNSNLGVITNSNKGQIANVLTRNYNYGINNNNTYVSDVDNIGAFNNIGSDTKKYWLEKCDPTYFPKPYETNSLSSGNFYKQVDKDLNYLADVNFDGYSTLRYTCNDFGSYACDFKTYRLYGTGNNEVSTNSNPISYDSEKNGVDYNIGYCGDGVVTGYGTNDAIEATTESNREQCDPKNHIIGPNGSDSDFGDNALYGCRRNNQFSFFNSDFVFGKDCSSFITPATSNNADRQYQCTFDCAGTGGYCGDGVIQDQFFEECDPGASGVYEARGVINNLSNATFKSNYICGVQNGYEAYSFDSEYQNNKDLESSFDGTSFKDDSKSRKGKDASCKTFGGYCGDGAVQVCSIGDSFYGGDKSYNSCLFNSSDPLNESNKIGVDADGDYAFIFNTSALKIESCDSNESACFAVSGNTVLHPVMAFEDVDMYNFGSSETTKRYYSELSQYNSDGPGKSGASRPNGKPGVCGSSNNATGIANTYQLTDLCDIGTASKPLFNMASKSFEWNCVGFSGGKTESCSADTTFVAERIDGSCGSDNDYVCNEPACIMDGKKVYEGDQCISGNDCVDKKVSDSLTVKICEVECSYKGDVAASGQACDLGRTCVGNIKQKFASLQAIKNKCNAGFADDASNNGTNWTWRCYGLNGGTSSDCSAKSSLSVDGECNDTVLGYCTTGIADEPRFNNSKNQWEWKCAGFNGGDFSSCSKGAFGSEKASLASCVNNKSSISLYDLKYSNNIYNPTGLCSGGVPSVINFSSYTSKYSWTCKSPNSNPTTVSCTANSITTPFADGICGSNTSSLKTSASADKLCLVGYPTNVIYMPAFEKIKWSCKGVGVNPSNAVKDAKCSANVPPVSVSGKCGSPMNMFVSSSGVQNPVISKELKDAGMFTIPSPAQALKFQLCKSGYPTALSSSGSSSGDSWADKMINFGETRNNQCDYSDNKYVSSDCMNIKIRIPMIGNIQIFHMTMPWQWTCNGVNSGADKNCFIFNPSMFFKQNGSCGADNGKTFADASLVMNRCWTGYSSNVEVTSNIPGNNKITWTCDGFNKGSGSSCSANLKPTGKVDGSCGSSKDQSGMWNYSNINSPCSNGVYSDLAIIQNDTNKTVQWSWKCKGISGGKTVSCSTNSNWLDASNNKVTVLKGKCKSLTANIYKSTSDIHNAGGCEFGIIKNIRYVSTSNKFTWNCEGSSVEDVDKCEVSAGTF